MIGLKLLIGKNKPANTRPQSDFGDYDWEVAPEAPQFSPQISELRAARQYYAPKKKDPLFKRMLTKLKKKKRAQVCEQLQSMEAQSTGNPQTIEAENITFVDGVLSDTVSMGDFSGGNYDQDSDETAKLSDYLSRPVLIHTLNWPENTPINTATTFIYPWSLYFKNAAISRKLHNFSRLRAKLHIKFIVNASPFYYGSLRACYFPLKDTRSAYYNANDQIPSSQVPGVYLEPATMTTAEMVLPFLWPNNWLEVQTDSQFVDMGVFNFVQYANLRSANGVVGSGATIQVYAWAEDVELMGPTTIAPLQSDEYETNSGTISGPATAVASVAARLDDVPVIGPFARATQIGARTVASIARLFGFSNPPVIDDVHGYQNKTFHAFANTETRMPIDKLCLDPKNEVTISSKVAGISEDDPLAFKNLLTKESFIQGTNWNSSGVPNTVLWTAAVHPGYATPFNDFFCTTPAAYVAFMFKYWRGSIKYRFKFIKTKYHTGRVAIMWDPAGDPLSAGLNASTTIFTRIVDIQEEDDVEFIVPYKARTPMLAIKDIDDKYYSNGPSPSIIHDPQSTNGILTMKILNRLTGPAANPEIDILVYVSMGDDFTFAVPINILPTLTSADPAGVLQSQETDVSQSTPTIDQHVASITTGESIASLRPLLHRTSLSIVQFLGDPRADTVGYKNCGNFYGKWPVGFGRMSNGVSFAALGSPAVTTRFSFACNHPVDFVSNMFVGIRGSMNWHANITDGDSRVKSLAIERVYHNPTIAVPATNVVQNGFTRTFTKANICNLTRDCGVGTAATYTRYPKGTSGLSLTNPTGQPALSVNIPQYQPVRFTPAFFRNRNWRAGDDQWNFENFAVLGSFWNTTASADGAWPVVSLYASAGADFQVLQFLCTPRLWLMDLPAAVDTT